MYGISSPLSVRSMNVRTPLRRRESSLGRCGSIGVQGYSQASRSGVAQYELGIGRVHTAVRGLGTFVGERACNLR